MPADISGWLAAGADFNQWKAVELADVVGRVSAGGQLVIFEAPLGRRHEATGKHINFLVFIEVPLEIALARFVMRELSGDRAGLIDYIHSYESLAREVYLEQLRQVMPEADLIVDGSLTPAEIVEAILEGARAHEWASTRGRP